MCIHASCYYVAMIRSFADRETEKLEAGRRSKVVPEDAKIRARKKLGMLEAATDVEDLRMPPSNRLEKLSGDREGQYSIRINQQYRLCFRFESGDAYDVEITDYH